MQHPEVPGAPLQLRWPCHTAGSVAEQSSGRQALRVATCKLRVKCSSPQAAGSQIPPAGSKAGRSVKLEFQKPP